jgi:trimethylamine:corrinoid methyltransferase-like protein
MKPIEQFLNVMSETDLEKIRLGALDLLEDPGMRIGAAGLRKALARKGAAVEETLRVVRFPRRMIEEVIGMAVAEEKERRLRCQGDTVRAERALAFNWHVAHMLRSPNFDVALGGGCPMYYDYPTRGARYGNESDLVRLLHVAEGIPEIRRCGNPIHCIFGKDGKDLPRDLMALTTAAIIAKHSSKPGVTTLLSAWQLPYSVAMGEVICSSPQAYQLQPIFININDTVPPLELSEPEGDIVEALARRGLPVFNLPMPLMGISDPLTVFSCAVAGVAEILGTWACAKAVNPDAPVDCAVVAGVLDPASGKPSFSAPEAIAIDLTAAQFLRSLGLRCGTGVGLIDAPAPGARSIFERTLKSTLAALSGESSYVVGILAGGNIFSPEQMMLDLDIGSAHHHFLGVFDPEDLTSAVPLLREKGIGGFFMDTEHTVANFRARIWRPRTFERGENPEGDPVSAAYERWSQIMSRTNPYHLPTEQSREIDRILARAAEDLGVSASSGIGRHIGLTPA